eukprot:CAMPEP_0176188208 /NCGR_PEP_ID=MMETSP0121_2-20121125/2796_1 /TAXON_ID=160619 /ORGANISM="Kryptoperidinium foliaceum, Strain CCMP 1326" /LENGTH=139 /DNA_ID=CAMNT_0017526775 /DNA_START=113 /DNA_END=532 /DNA_ORIENTATION=-
MNTVAMAFIVSIDEVLFEAILPQHVREDVANIDLILPSSKRNDERYWENKKRKAFKTSMMYMICGGIFIFAYAEYFQDVLPADIHLVREHCQVRLDQTHQPFCNGWTWYLRGNPAARECFGFRKKSFADVAALASALDG